LVYNHFFSITFLGKEMKVSKFLIGILAICFLAGSIGCGSRKADTPLEALKAYTLARKKKDASLMKKILSQGSIKMSEDEAKSQNRPLDEVILNDTFFPETVTSVEFKNEKIDGETATIEVKNQFGVWDRVPFILENGSWKIAKERYADELIKQSEEQMKELDNQINQGIPHSSIPQ
jgi:hypothetical protein